MTKQELIDLYRGLHKAIKLKEGLKNAKYAYALAKNIAMIKPEMEALDKANEDSEEFKELRNKFEPKRIEIVEKYANKDKDGKPLKKITLINGEPIEIYDMSPENQKKSNTETSDAIKEMNPELVAAREAQSKSYQDILKEEVQLMFHKIREEDLPADIGEYAAVLFPIIAE